MAASMARVFRFANIIPHVARSARCNSPRMSFSGLKSLTDQMQSLAVRTPHPFASASYSHLITPPTFTSHKLLHCASVYKSSPLASRPRVSLIVPKRNVVTCSRKRGMMMTKHEVPKRFYRLRSGLWIRTIAGKWRRHWKRTPEKIWEIRQHVFCNQHQNEMLDKMVSRYYKRPRYWVNNIYEPYEERTGVTEGFKVPKRPFYP